MAQGDYTLAINSSLTQDISALTINGFPRNSRPAAPESFEFVAVDQWTPGQVPLVAGNLRDRLVWNVATVLDEAASLKLMALFRWQQNRLLNKLDGRLTWTDEIFYMAPEATPTRTLLANLTSADGQTYGYPVVDCIITQPLREIFGRSGTSFDYLCTFQIQETRSVT
jgi:hypothetical protein